MRKSSITAVLKMIFERGDVFEIRIFDLVLANLNCQYTESGYFDYDHMMLFQQKMHKIVTARLAAGYEIDIEVRAYEKKVEKNPSNLGLDELIIYGGVSDLKN